MTEQRLSQGRRAEQIAADHLTAQGWQLLARNARTRQGEIDIVARRGGQLAFVEVKSGRQGAAFGPERPAFAVDRRKQLRLRRLAAAWLGSGAAPRACSGYRFDVIGVTFGPDGELAELEHIEQAFW